MRGRTDISEIRDNGSIDSTDRLRTALIFIHIHEFKMAAGVAWECLVFPSSVKEKIKLQSGLLDKQPIKSKCGLPFCLCLVFAIFLLSCF